MNNILEKTSLSRLVLLQRGFDLPENERAEGNMGVGIAFGDEL